MSDIEAEVSATLRALAENWLKRRLTPAEIAELDQFQRDWNRNAPAENAQAVQSVADPAAKVRQQAAQAVSEVKQRSETAIREVLQKLQGTAAHALQAYESEEQAILKVVEAARSLNDLRPSSLNLAASAAPPSAQMMLPQIADRLANLIKSEVDQCFERHFGPLQRQLAAVLNQHQAAQQVAQQAGHRSEQTSAQASVPSAPLPTTATQTLPAQGTAPPVMR
ncbi:hypothetical protein [Paraburkholderia antibiotica]|uniref:Uncharacterized protein n=1 Tax=Paraburkholderia antibiotica TaxID=2728839 RepID=A0A7X9X7H1_9BURK|nr:hypothetical protein [Paraburkholderia antibiotica]NML32805.1 hypothetical protein [Paraburkholderia antibiotica]